MKNIIVTRHSGIVEWLKGQGINGEVITHVNDPDQVAGRVVYGILPYHLAFKAVKIVTIDMPELPAEKRGVDLTPDEMDAYGAKLSAYIVMKANL